MKKIIALILCALMIFGCVGCTGSEEKAEKETEPTTSEIDPNHSLVVLKTDNFEINCGMLSYLYLYGFYGVYSNYGSYFDSMGFDHTKELDQQQYTEDMTWHDYFLEMTMSDAKTFLRVAEAAKAADFPIEGFEKEAEEALVNMAVQSGITEDEYIEKMFGNYLDRADLISALTLQLYAYKYYETVGKQAQNDISDEACEEYYSQNANTLNKVDYISYTIAANTADTEDTEAAYNQAKLKAEELVAKTAEAGLEGYKSWVAEYMKKANSESTTPMEESALETQIQKTLEGTAAAAYSAGNELSEWAFENGRVEGDTKLVDNGAGSYTVTVISKTPYRDEAITRNVRHILLKPESYENDSAAALAKAEEVLSEWRAGEATEESFEDLADKYNDDGNCLYENVTEGEMTQSFNDWLFDPSRKSGDTDIVKTDYGYHIMYFVSVGNAKWKCDVINTLANATLTTLLTEYETNYVITENEENIEKLPKLIPQSALETSTEQSGVNVY